MKPVLGSVVKPRRRPESEQFYRLAKTAKQAMLVLSSMQPDAARRKKGRSKPDRVFRQSLILLSLILICPAWAYAQETKSVVTGDRTDKAKGQTYEPDWVSLTKHPRPAWFDEAKVGIFIHYSSPGRERAPAKFSAEEWIGLFKKAGAKYFVFTAKHNGGWCNWPSEITQYSAARRNGPLDLVTPLVETARREGMKVGIYYNLMDSTQGVTRQMAVNANTPDGADVAGFKLGATRPSDEYVTGTMIPQIQELVSTYEPDIFWTDGDWISTSDVWRSTEIVAWLYNWAESQGREICLTDRWGRDIRIATIKETPVRYGDFWTLERRIMKDIVTVHPWESCVTLNESWHYSSRENFRAPVNELIAVMCDVISKGGNFLINIGPAPDGSVTEADKKTLLDVGKWLSVNGEAIYGSTPLKRLQRLDTEKNIALTKDLLLPTRINGPYDETWDLYMGQMSSQGPVRYTVKGGTLYAIHQGWPGEMLELHDLGIKPGSEIKMLGVDEPLAWQSVGHKTIIKLPSAKPCEHAFVLRMEEDQI